MRRGGRTCLLAPWSEDRCFPEPVEVITAIPMGESVKLIAKGLKTGRVHDPILNADQLAQLTVSPATEPFDGDAVRFRLGIEAERLGLAYEYDPYFSLSIARVDPLPHQLEAVYEYFLPLPRIRFLLADDPGAGKTIMAGLLLKELKIRGLVQRTLIVAPANLTFQWQREMKDKFRETFVLRSRWDLVIVDEAHKMSAYSHEKKTLAFQLGEALSERTDHYLLMTATPHKGDPENFRLFLSLLDRDVYGDVKSLEEAMRRHEAPFYLRRTKEALVSFPDEQGNVHPLFTNRDVRTAKFDLDGEEYDFYDALTRYVEDQSMKAAASDSPQARALGFIMAMLQRRFASSVYAVRRSLERMREKREKILEDPEKYRREQIERRLPDDFDDLTEEEQDEIRDQLEGVVVSIDPAALRDEIQRLAKLIERAKALEAREVESKLAKLREVLNEQNIFGDQHMKLLVFTEHKDTLDYLAGDGRDGRPLGKLREWGLTVTQIHGGMKIGDRDRPGTRIHAERAFREDAQVLVATEAAGEGINLQFCWFMINYDIPWNPVRLEQRMGRIHRYGQTHDCLIFNFVAVNTREGRVLHKLLARLLEIKNELGTDKVFDVVGEVFPSNLLEKLFREMYAQRLSAPSIEERIVREFDPERFREITDSTLEGLAKRELNPGRARRQVGRGQGAPPRPRGHRGLLRCRRADRRRAPLPAAGKPACLPHRQGAEHSRHAGRGAGAQVRPARQGLPAHHVRQGPPRRRSDPGMGDAGPSPLRGRAGRRPRAGGRRPAARSGLLRPALGRALSGRRLRRLHQGRPRQHAAPPALRDALRPGRHALPCASPRYSST